jgi:hypothetical protein
VKALNSTVPCMGYGNNAITWPRNGHGNLLPDNSRSPCTFQELANVDRQDLNTILESYLKI